MEKLCVTFAGCPGSSKTPITNFLSTKCDLPVFNNDAIRTEVIEDMGVFDESEYVKRRNLRIEAVAKSGISFIYDASVDREWKLFEEALKKAGYQSFVISLDLGRDLLEHLYKVKGYTESLARLDVLFAEHQSFLEKHDNKINVHITDAEFSDRITIAYQSLKDFLNNTK